MFKTIMMTVKLTVRDKTDVGHNTCT